MKRFFEIQKHLIDERFAQSREMMREIDFTERLIGIVGPRGVGKSTILIDHLSRNNLSTSLYISADNIYFLDQKLFDFALRFKNEYDGKLLIIDEIHKYANWQQELKNIYDSIPSLRLIFSGSSSLDLRHGNYDLSRRARLYHLHGFSFREYLCYVYGLQIPQLSLDELLTDHLDIAQRLGAFPVLKYFREYLISGYYPYYVNEKKQDFSKIIETIEKTIYDDIASYYHVRTENLIFFKKILSYLSVMEPGEININKISKTLEIDNKTVNTYLEILEKGGLIRFLLRDTFGYSIMKNTSKVYLENTNLVCAIDSQLQKEVNIGMIREIFFINALQNSKNIVSFSKVGDFVVNDTIFEIGGKNKTVRQISSLERSYLVQDDILVGEKHIIPLYLFGLL